VLNQLHACWPAHNYCRYDPSLVEDSYPGFRARIRAVLTRV